MAEHTKIVIQLDLTSDYIEFVSVPNNLRGCFKLQPDSKFKLSINNLYRLPITNKTLNSDNYHAIKQNSLYCEFFKILGVINGKVIIQPILTTPIDNNIIIGELI